MKTSIYNIRFDLEDQALVFNTKSGTLVVANKDNKDKIAFLTSDIAVSDDVENIDVFQKLGMVVTDDFDELAFVKARFWRSKFIDKTMRMMLSTTFNCNFHCDYCFENIPNTKQRVSKMNKEVENAIYNFIESRIHELETIEIHWFGGEPLLNTNPIFSLGKRISLLASQNNIKLIQDVISNGYLLDKDLAQQLYDNGVTEAQITFDGPRSVHDKRRYCKIGVPSFDKILKNVIDFQDIITAKIRVNTDRRNIDDMFSFVDELVDAGINSRTRVHFGMARNFNQGALMTNELRAEEFREKIHPVYEYAISKNINIDYGISMRPKTTVCDAAKRNTIHVGPDGTIWKCFPLIGTSRGQCGNILDFGDITESEMFYQSFDPFSYSKCRDCKLIPICMRRCPYDDMCLNVNDSMCNFYMLDEMKDRISLILKSGNKNQNIESIVII